MEKQSFIFYASFYEALQELSDKSRLKLYDAITSYALEGVEHDLTGIEKAVFALIKPQLRANNQRYENGKKGAEFGKLGGRPKKPQENPKGDKSENGKGDMEENPTETPNENENENVNVNVIPPLLFPPKGEKTINSADKFFSLYPRYAKNREKMRVDVDYDKLIEEFEKSTYLRSLYTVKQINENYPLIIAGDFRDKVKAVDGVTAGREYMADRERWYSERKHKAQSKADEIVKRFMQDDTFKSIERRLRELMPEIARLEVEAEKGEIKAKQKLVKLTQEQGRLRQQRLSIIERNGMTEEDLIPQWHCKKCQDTGYQEDGKLCDCYGG